MRIHSYKFHPFSHLESGESVNSQCFQSMFRIFHPKVQISRIAGKAALCLQQTNLGNGSLLQSDSLSGKNSGTG